MPTTPPATNTVSARGRVEPQGEVIRLSASTSLETVKIHRLLVKEGDKVISNQVIAILDNYNRLWAALKQAKQQVKVAQANLAKVKAGVKTGEINAQKAQIARLQAQLFGERKTQQATIARLQAQLLGERRTQQANIARLQAQLSNAQTEFGRFQMLYKEGAVEASKFDSKRLELETAREQLNAAKASLNQTEETLQQQINEAKATLKQTEETLQQQINEAKATLNQIAEVRPTDVQAAQAEVESAIAAVEKAQADLELTYVRAPKDGQILKIYTFPGEIVGNEGIADMGQTDQMYVVAEVYETDVSQVRIGQQARITSEAFPGELYGKVTQVGLQVKKQAIFSTDPVADVDRRVVEVKIRLNPKDAKQVRSLTNLQVEVVINTEKF
ncbi:devB secretion protein [Chlorogloeopsis fritschii PCC 6912]|uniref:DevB secretion protein n=1 Tax=Chlorogloeopsis fritschii PCC 6912 TaxID=211165 RepID=A0A3S1A2E6_CHLFR|nr:devB secretion protein [Chlorogloeopsis fritschii PCC 6912]